MKRKWKWLILLVCIPVLLFAVWLWLACSSKIPVDFVGELSEKDVAEIVAAVRSKMRREVFPNFSWQSLKSMPGVIKRNSSIKLITIFKTDLSNVNVPAPIRFTPGLIAHVSVAQSAQDRGRD